MEHIVEIESEGVRVVRPEDRLLEVLRSMEKTLMQIRDDLQPLAEWVKQMREEG